MYPILTCPAVGLGSITLNYVCGRNHIISCSTLLLNESVIFLFLLLSDLQAYY
jgi:hypothetical protein